MERETGIEPATSSLGSLRSTPELLPLRSCPALESTSKGNRPKLQCQWHSTSALICFPLTQNPLSSAAVAEPVQVQPAQAAVATKPSHLPLREPSRPALDCLDGLCLRKTGNEVSHHLGIAEALQPRGPRVEATCQQPFHFFRPPGAEHGCDATVDTLVQTLPGPGETDHHRHGFQPAGIVRLPSLRPLASICQGQLEGTEHSNGISGLYLARSDWIEATQFATQALASLLPETNCQPGTKGSTHRRRLGESVDRRRQVQSRAANQQYGAAPGLNQSDPVTRQGREASGTEGLGGIDQVDHVMADDSTLNSCRFGSSDVQPPVDLPGVDGDNVSAYRLRQLQGQLGLADGRRTDDGQASGSTGH